MGEREKKSVERSFVESGILMLVPGARRDTLLLGGAVDMGKRLDVSCAVTLSYSERGLLGRPKHRAGHKPQARMVARQVRPRLPDGRSRQGEGQAGLLPYCSGRKRPKRPIGLD